MPLIVDTSKLAPQLVLKASVAGEDYSVQVDAEGLGRIGVGRIMRVQRSAGREAWFWTITGPAAPDAGVSLNGEEESLQAARDAMRAAYDAVMVWAGLKNDGELPWHHAGHS